MNRKAFNQDNKFFRIDNNLDIFLQICQDRQRQLYQKNVHEEHNNIRMNCNKLKSSISYLYFYEELAAAIVVGLEQSDPITLHLSLLLLEDSIKTVKYLSEHAFSKGELRYLSDGVLFQLYEKIKYFRMIYKTVLSPSHNKDNTCNGSQSNDNPVFEKEQQENGQCNKLIGMNRINNDQNVLSQINLDSPKQIQIDNNESLNATIKITSTTSSSSDIINSKQALFCCRTSSNVSMHSSSSHTNEVEYESNPLITKKQQCIISPSTSSLLTGKSLDSTEVIKIKSNHLSNITKPQLNLKNNEKEHVSQDSLSHNIEEDIQDAETILFDCVQLLTKKGYDVKEAYEKCFALNKAEMYRIIRENHIDASANDPIIPNKDPKSLFKTNRDFTTHVSDTDFHKLMEQLKRKTDECAIIAFGNRNPHLSTTFHNEIFHC